MKKERLIKLFEAMKYEYLKEWVTCQNENSEELCGKYACMVRVVKIMKCNEKELEGILNYYSV